MLHLGCQKKFFWYFWAFLVLIINACLHSWFVSNDSWSFLDRFLWCRLKCIVWVLSLFFWEASMLAHGAGIGYTCPDGPHWQFQSGDGVSSRPAGSQDRRDAAGDVQLLHGASSSQPAHRARDEPHRRRVPQPTAHVPVAHQLLHHRLVPGTVPVAISDCLHSLLPPVNSNPYGLRSRDHNLQPPVCNSFSRKSFIIRSRFRFK